MFENGIEQENFYEEINQILSNDFSFEFGTQNFIMQNAVERPKNPFYKNFDLQKDEEKK